MSIVKVNEIIKKYGDVTAIDRVSMEIVEGEIYGLLGPNGAGKSTLIGVICDAIRKDSGEIYLFDQLVGKNIIDLKRNIGIVPQDVAIYEDLTAKENVKFFGSLYGLRGDDLNKSVDEALQFVGLDPNNKMYPKTFSGGMKRRLNIACAIVHKPKLIIMDEPTVGIDPQSRHHILNSVLKLNELGSTIIYTTHLMEEAEFLCTRIGIIDHGKIIAEGTNEALQSIVTDRKTLVIKLSVFDNLEVERIKGIKGVVTCTLEDATLTIESMKESDCTSDILAELKDQNASIKDINMKSVSLENTFLSLTGRRLRD